MREWRRRLRRRLWFLFGAALLRLAPLVPRRPGLRLCEGLALLALRVRPRERERARANLAAAFPERDAATREALLLGAARAAGRNLYDTLTLERRLRRGLDDVDGEPTLERLRELRAQGRGVLVLTGHLGCWELLGAYLARGLGGLAVITGTIHNAPVDRLVNRWRRRAGMIPVPRAGDQRPLLRHLRGGGVAAVLLDQNTRAHNVAVPFLGRPAPTAAGMARLALRLDLPVLPVAIARRGEGHEVVHLPPLRPADHDGPGREADFLAACNEALGELVRRNPEEWVWFHDRWGDGDRGAATREGTTT